MENKFYLVENYLSSVSAHLKYNPAYSLFLIQFPNMADKQIKLYDFNNSSGIPPLGCNE